MRTDIHALSGAYALDAINADERVEFERHLLGCSTCRDEVDSLTETATSLASLTATTPPPSRRDAVLAGTARVRPLPPPSPATHQRRWWIAAAAAAAAAVIVIGGAVMQPWSNGPSGPVTVAQVAEAGDVQRLSSTLADGSSVTVYRSVDLDRVAVVAHDMADLREGQVYQVWLQDDDGTMLPAGLMPTGSRSALVLDGSARDTQGVGITVEPAGGSPAPTSDPVTVVGFDQA